MLMVGGWPVLAIGSQPHVVPAAAFTPRSPYELYQFHDSKRFLAAQDSDWDCFYAPLLLPNGAVINLVTMLFYDNHENKAIDLELFEMSWSNGVSTRLTTWPSASISSTRRV